MYLKITYDKKKAVKTALEIHLEWIKFLFDAYGKVVILRR